MTGPIERAAEISGGTELWRWWLSRIWDAGLPILWVVMLNPSKADGKQDDPTVLRLIAIAQRWGFGGIMVVNLFAYRASRPDVMWAMAGKHDLIGPRGDEMLLQALEEAGRNSAPILAAWGAHRPATRRAEWFVQQARQRDVRLICLGRTADGSPTHPAARGKHRVPDDVKPQPFRELVDA